MKLNTTQLHSKLQSESLPPVIWLSGDEPLLAIEASDSIRAAATARGISERRVIDVDARFDGADLIAANQSLSLFGDRELIELRCQSKFNDKGRKALLEYIEMANPDNLLLIISDRIDAAQTKAKWFNQVQNAGWWVPLWPVEYNQLPGWITQRINQCGLQADPDAVALLAERVDGNLLAAKQEIDKLALLAENGRVSTELILNSVSDSSRYTVFDLSAAFLRGDLSRSLKILHTLEAEGSEPPVILWLITRELRLLLALGEAQTAGQPMAAVYKRLRIFGQRQNDYQQALNRASPQHFQHCLLSCARIDSMIKGQVKGDVWNAISEMLVAISVPDLPAYHLD